MKTALIFLTDERGYSLTEHAAAVTFETQKTTKSIIIFCYNFMPPANSRLAHAAKNQGFNLSFRSLDNHDQKKIIHNSKGAQAHVTFTATLKITAIDNIAQEFDRIVYLDGDILLMEDMNVEKIDFENRPIAAVYDIAKVGCMSTEPNFYLNCIKNGRSPHYFNSGVIAVDLKQWKNTFPQVFNHFIEDHHMSCDYKDNCSCVDQCAWNRLFERNWKRLPLSMNLQACAMFSERWQYASIRHYVGPIKFIPFKAWRNDSRDLILINQARKLLELPPIGLGWPGFIRSLNSWRNRWRTKETCEAISRVEKMASEAF